MGSSCEDLVPSWTVGVATVNDLFQRASYDPPRTESFRLVAATVLTLVASAGWHGSRGLVLQCAARSSVGCPGREGLIVAALTEEDFNFPDHARLWSSSLPGRGWVAWASVPDSASSPSSSQVPKWRITIADHLMHIKGRFVGENLSLAPVQPGSEATWTVVTVSYPQKKKNSLGELTRHAIIRLGEEGNEIVGLVLIDRSGWQARGTRVNPIWRDENGDGVSELAFITVVSYFTPEGKLKFKQPATVAVFSYDPGCGVFRPTLLPDDGSFLSWTPTDDAPVRVGHDVDLDPVLRSLLPVPPGFAQ